MHLVALALFLQGVMTPPTVPVVGSARFQIIITPPAKVTVESPRSQVRPLAISIDSGARYDRKTRTLTLSVAITNNWTRGLVAPARLISWPDSFFHSTYSGVLPKGREYYILPSNADSAIGDAASRSGKSYFWRYDALIGTPPHLGRLQPGERSRSRVIRLTLEEGSSSNFTMILHAEVGNPHVFPEYPPVIPLSDLIVGAPVVIDGAGFSGRVLADIVQTRIATDLPLATRQRMLDLARGDVIGATPRSGNDPRTFYIRLEAVPGGAPVDSLEQRLAMGGMSTNADWSPRPIVLDSLLVVAEPREPLFLSPIRGCATIRVRLAASGGAIGDILPRPGCGPVVPVMIGLASFDREKRIVSIKLVVTNEWTQPVAAPLRVLAWNDSIYVTRPQPPPPPPPPPRPITSGERPPPPPPPNVPRGRTEPRVRDDRVRFLEPDSSIGAAAPAWTLAQVWRFDDRFRDSAGRAVLAPDATTGERVVRLQLSSDPVAEFSFRVWALGESMHPVPVPAPVTGDPPGAFDTSYWIAGRKGLGTSPVLDDLLDVTFIPNSSQEDLQAAVDSVGGEAVGGYKRLLGLSTYVVRIPADTSGATLLAALATLRSFGTVLLAMPIDARSGAARYREEEVARLRMSFPRARTKSDSAKFPNGVYKHLVRVTFRFGASPLAIQAAIDQVRGTMLECDIFTNWCVIRVPIDGTPTDLAHVVTALNAMPQVKRAGFELELTGMRP